MFTRLFLSCVCAAVVCGVGACGDNTQAPREAVVVDVVAPALRVRAGAETPLAASDVLGPKDVVRTGDGGSAVLLLRSNGVVVKLAGAQELEVQRIAAFESARSSKTTEEQLEQLLHGADRARLDNILVNAERVAGFQHRTRAGSTVASVTSAAPEQPPPPPPSAPPSAEPTAPLSDADVPRAPSAKLETSGNTRPSKSSKSSDAARAPRSETGFARDGSIGGLGGSSSGSGGGGVSEHALDDVGSADRKQSSAEKKKDTQGPPAAPGAAARPAQPTVVVTLQKPAAVQYERFNAAVANAPLRFAACAQSPELSRTIVVDVVLGAGVVTSATARDGDPIALCVAGLVSKTTFSMLKPASDKDATKHLAAVMVRFGP